GVGSSRFPGRTGAGLGSLRRHVGLRLRLLRRGRRREALARRARVRLGTRWPRHPGPLDHVPQAGREGTRHRHFDSLLRQPGKDLARAVRQPEIWRGTERAGRGRGGSHRPPGPGHRGRPAALVVRRHQGRLLHLAWREIPRRGEDVEARGGASHAAPVRRPSQGRRMRARHIGLPAVAIAVLAWVMIGATGSAGEQSKSALAFARLASLVGEWKGVQDGTEIHVTYTLTANGSRLMEEFRPANGPAMVTMFSVDGDRLLATHYCSAKNQPQMATAAIADPSGKSVAFSLVRVTGLRSPGAWHNTGLTVTLEDQDHLTQKWTYLSDGKAGTNFFHFTRAR